MDQNTAIKMDADNMRQYRLMTSRRVNELISFWEGRLCSPNNNNYGRAANELALLRLVRAERIGK